MQVPSTVIRHFRYDPQSNRLVIVFQSGLQYVYENVPHSVHAELCSASSRGAYFNRRIRDRFPYTRSEEG